MDKSNRRLTRADFPFFEAHTARYNAVDAQGIVYNPRYLEYFDLAITEYMLAVRPDFFDWAKTTGADFNAVHAEIDWRVPLPLGAAFIVGARVDRLGRSSIQWRCAVFRDGEAVASANAVIVWVYADQIARASRPLPDDLRAAIEAKEAE